MINIYIFGYTGMLGNYVYKYLSSLNTYNIFGFNRNNLNILDANFKNIDDFLYKYIDKHQYNIIINVSGIIPQSLIDDNHKYYKINAIFPQWLTILSHKYNFKIIHISTDCVFSGCKGLYNENDIHDSYDDYGKSKSLGENNQITIIRTSIIGEEIYNKKSLLEWIKSNKNSEINGYTNHLWNGVTCYQLAKIINQIITNNLFWEGVRHIYSPNIVSKYDLAIMINNIYNLNIKINKYNCEKTIDKTLSSIYNIDEFDIPSLEKQLIEQLGKL